MRRNLQRREEIGKKGGKVKKWVLKFSFSSPLRPFSCSLCSLERGSGKINKIKGKGEEKEGPREEKGEVFTLPTFTLSTNLTNYLGTCHCYDYV